MVKFTEKILHVKLRFLCSGFCYWCFEYFIWLLGWKSLSLGHRTKFKTRLKHILIVLWTTFAWWIYFLCPGSYVVTKYIQIIQNETIVRHLLKISTYTDLVTCSELWTNFTHWYNDFSYCFENNFTGLALPSALMA